MAGYERRLPAASAAAKTTNNHNRRGGNGGVARFELKLFWHLALAANILSGVEEAKKEANINKLLTKT